MGIHPGFEMLLEMDRHRPSRSKLSLVIWRKPPGHHPVRSSVRDEPVRRGDSRWTSQIAGFPGRFHL